MLLTMLEETTLSWLVATSCETHVVSDNSHMF